RTEWGGREFTVIDTGGYVSGSDDVFEGEIRKQVEIALEEATIVLFVVDVESGITDLDEAVAEVLRRNPTKVFVVVNKVDNNARQLDSMEFYSLGMGEIYSISSINGAGTGELLDEVVQHLKEDVEAEDLSELPRLAVVGRPNAGKSSLINALIGQDRNIVTNIAGTTRDAVDTRYKAFGFDFNLVDTAGVRKKAKVNEDLEFYSVLRAIRSIETADVCLLMVDAEAGFAAQDVNIFHLIARNKKGVVILVNKWDLIEKDNHTTKRFEEQIREKIAPFSDVPVLFVSVLNKQRIYKALELAVKVYHNRTKKIKTSELNEKLLPIIQRTPPPSTRGRYIKIKFITQLPTHAPSFAFFCNHPTQVKESYRRFMENKLRELFDFEGVPISIFFRQK
ncbi:MAG: ribosome biogenesis GTPase Der, partial [Salibacteraceae bacterium]